MTADGAGDMPATDDQLTHHQLSGALRGGTDAVFIVRKGDAGELVVELANETARLLFGLSVDHDVHAVLGATCPPSARPIVASLEQAASRSRATRETLMLPGPDGGRVAVDLQLEPLPGGGTAGARILAVVRASDPALEPGINVGASAMTVGVLRYERGLGVVFVDDSVLALLGLAHEHALGQGWLDSIHVDDRGRVAAAFEAADGADDVLDLEFRLVVDHLRDRWARLRAVPERSHELATGYLATIEDITDQRVLTQSSARLAELADVVEDWVGIVDAHGNFVYANAVARRGLGLPRRDAVTGGPAVGVLANDPRTNGVRMEAESLHTGIWTGPILLRAIDGRRIEIAGTVRSHQSPDGSIDHYSFTGRDTADARFAAHEMLRLRRAVEATTDFITFHARGGRMLFANRAARELIGVGPNEPLPSLGMNDFFAMTPEQLVVMREAITDDGRWEGELEVHGHDLRIPASVVVTGHRDASGRYEYFSALSRDVTDRRAADAARRRIETALRGIVQSSPLPIFALDAKGVVHVWSHAAEDLFGWRAADVIGGPPPFITSPEELDALTAPAFSGDTVHSHEARYERRDGRPIDANVAVAPLRNAAGRVVSAVVVVADVTDQRRAELALRESEVRFRSLVQDSSDMVTIVAADGSVPYRSPSACKFVGLDPADDFGQVINDPLFEEDRPAVASAFRRLEATPGSSELVRYRFRRHDGELRWIEMVATNHLDDEAVRGIVTNCRDITDRVEAESTMRASEERLRALLENISDVVSVIGADGELKYSSPSVERVYGYADGAWPEGQSIFDTVHPDDRDRILELWTGSLSTPGEFRPLELRLRKGDGTWIYTEVVANNLIDDPAVNGIVVTSRDITQRKQSEEALRASESRLRESEARYRAIVDDQTELVCRYLPDATLTFTNRAFAEFFGSTSDELASMSLADLRPASERARTFETMLAAAAGGLVGTHVECEVSLDGSLRWYEWTDRAFANEAGDIVEFQSVGHDITDQRRAAEFTVHQAEILEQVARGVALDETLLTIASALEDQFPRFSCVIMLIGADGATLRAGPAPTLSGRVLEALDGTSVAESSCSSGAAAYLREPVYVHDVMTDERWIEHREVAAAHGLHASWSTPILSSDGNEVLGTFDVFVPEPRDPDDEHRRIFVQLAQLASIAIERKAFEERLAHQSMHDSLTALPNRLLFLDRLGQAVARCVRTGSSVAVLFLDLDRFKNINDSLGHDAGDELLVEVARKLEAVIRPGDTVARFGGDEFTVLCEDLTGESAREEAVEIAERLLSTVIRPLIVRGTEMFVGASIGIALSTSGEERPEELLRDADAAMYRAKEAGRGRVEVFDDTMRARALAVHATENALHRALERGEFRLFYQPILGLTDARCVGAEALVRWQHPERGLLPPAEFVPLAEETGLVVQIGWWVIQEAARNAARWQLEQTEPFQVAINLSARQLAQPDLPDRLAELIAESGVRPSTLCFEITESVLMDDAEAVLELISGIRTLGVQFAIDDFGTGYSSLGYLKRFPVDSVKIDRSFVNGLGADPGDAAIVSAVIGLAHALGLRVTAEGVETEDQLLALIALECDEAQGYFFSPPQPAPDLRSLIARTRTWRPPGAAVMRPAGRLRPRSIEDR